MRKRCSGLLLVVLVFQAGVLVDLGLGLECAWIVMGQNPARMVLVL